MREKSKIACASRDFALLEISQISQHMFLHSQSHEDILAQLKQYFTDEELDKISGKLDEFIADCDTLEDLIDDLEDYFAEEDGDELF